MSSLREMRLRIRSVRNIAQVTRALQTVSASKVRHAQAAVLATRPYALKAVTVLGHLADRRNVIRHPLLIPRAHTRNILVLVISGDRGLAGAYNAAVVREALERFAVSPQPVHYLVVGKKGRELLLRAGVRISAEFSNLPAEPAYGDTSAIGKLALEEYTTGQADAVHLVFTRYVNLVRQEVTTRQLLPLPDINPGQPAGKRGGPAPVYIFEPGQTHLLNMVVERLTQLEVYEAILESLASEHAARMMTMKNATDNAVELIHGLQLEYNKARQQAITGDLLDIVAGTEALAAQTHR
jgi:F-type H+-transporting ATPase subunit gamma